MSSSRNGQRAARYVIIGNGAAGVAAAETLRHHDPGATIIIVTAEPTRMYSRPGLAYVATGEIPLSQVVARSQAWYEEQRLDLVFARAKELDTRKQRLFLEDGRQLPYDRLLIATGARAVPPPYPDHTLPGVVYLDTLEGTRELLRQARRRRTAIVIGGGITALEMAEAFVARRLQTHYLVRRDRLWGKVFNQAESDILATAMRHHGVCIHTDTEAEEILPRRWSNRVGAARLAGGGSLPCDVFGVAIGVRPQLELARQASLEVDRGILVNQFLESSAPNVFAAGDCAQVYDPWAERHLLDILWPSAVAEGKAAAHNMAGRPIPYRKGISFNVCKLFELHIAIIGQIDPDPDGDDPEILQHLSRGSSESWFVRPHYHASAWDQSGPNTLRLVMGDGRLIGALLIGEQSLADPLRWLIEERIDVQPFLDELEAGGPAMRATIERLYRLHQLERRPPDPNGDRRPGA